MADNGQPVTRADLQALEDRLGQAIAQSEERLLERMQNTETKLLNAFFTYQEHEKIQFAKLRADTGNANRAAELRLDNLENRVIELERQMLRMRGGSPPQPQ